MAQAIRHRVMPWVYACRRVLGMSIPPVPLVALCPECEEPTMFRIEREDGWVAVCANPACRTDLGHPRQWTETEWEDRFDPSTWGGRESA